MAGNAWFWVLVGFLGGWLACCLVTWLVVRRRLFRSLASEEDPEAHLTQVLGTLRPRDRQALELIRARRRHYLVKLKPDTRLSLNEISDLAQTLVREVARVYHPEEERPELKASLHDLVGLYRRVGDRLAAWLEKAPLRPFRELELKTVLRYHELYLQVTGHPWYRFMRRHHLDRAARWGWGAANLANPWYWGWRAAYAGGREAMSRLFLAKVAALVGEEAMLLYGRRRMEKD
ncbi:MAG: hypothetical protein FJ128_06775 [Deltaproteobacteria bacterium]|nr:hypothetical protein [Deltaproteobacteria bacterium]